ncbi:MAG: glycosyltransferase [Aromatoleum sp.]|nr:glycosyltransferase [Aromatoleum sp.]
MADISALSHRRFSRLLFVSRAFPADFDRATYGIYMRMRVLLEAIRNLADDLDILFFVDPSVPISEELRRRTQVRIAQSWGVEANVFLAHERPVASDAGYWANYVAPVLDFRRNPDYAGMAGPEQVAAVEAALDRDISAIVVHRLDAMCPILTIRRKLPPIFLDLDDIEHRKLVRELARKPFYPGKLALFLRAPSVFLAELRAIRRTCSTFVCSQSDRRYLSHFVPSDRIAEVPNVATFPPDAPAASESETLLFLGSYTYAANVDAAEHLVRVLWPHIRALRPSATLLVAGQRPERIPSYAAKPPGVVFTGFVDDLAALYARVRVVCCPIRYGGGTRIKIIEAAGYGRPVVSTPIGAEGLVFTHPDEIVLARTDDEFAASCARLLGDADQARAVGVAARRRAHSAYDRDAVIAGVRRIVEAGLSTTVDSDGRGLA